MALTYLSEVIMSKTLDVYISLISPYSYVAHTQLASLVERTQSSIYYHILDLRSANRNHW